MKTGHVAAVLQATVYLVACVGAKVSFPLWLGVLIPNGADSYFVWLLLSGGNAAFWGMLVLFGLLVGKLSWKDLTLPHQKAFLAAFWYAQNGLIVYAADPKRTPQSLQPMLGMGLPFTLLMRQVLLHRHPVGKQRLGCAIVMVGIAICLSPTLYSFAFCSESKGCKPSDSKAMLWSVFYLFTTLGMSTTSVYAEEILDNPGVSTIYYLYWTELCSFLLVVSVFWTDMIPGFGYASGWDDFSTKFKHGLDLIVSGGQPTLLGVVFLSFWALQTLCQCVLIRSSDGAAWSSLVATLSTPLQTLFLSIVTVSKSGVAWNFQFSANVIVHVCGASLSVPGLLVYDRATRKATKSCRDVTLSDACESSFNSVGIPTPEKWLIKEANQV